MFAMPLPPISDASEVRTMEPVARQAESGFHTPLLTPFDTAGARITVFREKSSPARPAVCMPSSYTGPTGFAAADLPRGLAAV